MAKDTGPVQTSSPKDIGPLQSVGASAQTVDPSSISTGASFGTPSVIGAIGLGGIATGASFGSPNLSQANTVQPGGVGTGVSFGTPHIAYPSTISPGGISTGISMGVPNVGGPFIVDEGIPTGASFGVPFINQPVILQPGGIASGSAFGSVRMAYSTTLQPGSIASGSAFGSPALVGGQQKPAFQFGIPTGASFGMPTFTPTLQGLTCFIAGVNVTSFLQENAKAGLLRQGATGSNTSSAGSAQPLQITSQTLGRWQAVWDMIDYDGSFLPVLGQVVVFSEPAYRHFAGCITKLECELIMGTDTVIFHLTARDKSAICDRRLVMTPVYPAGMDMADVFRDIVTNYLPGEGITTTNVPASLGPLLNDFTLPAQLPTVTQAFDSLVQLYGGVWWIDSFGDLHAPPVSDIPDAPYEITSPTLNARGLRMTSDSAAYANEVFAVSNLAVQPGSSSAPAPPTPPVGITETYTLPQSAADALGYDLGTILTKFPIQVITDVKVNGVSQPFYQGQLLFCFQQSWWYWPSAPNNFLYPPNVGNTSPLPLPPVTSAYPMTGDVVEVTYVPASSHAQVSTGDPLAVADNVDGGPGTGTCGSGIWQKVIQVQNVVYQGDLQTVAAKALALYGVVQKQLVYETDIPGAVVGSKLHVDLPRLGLPDMDLMVTQMSGVSQQGVDLGFGSCLRWTITAVAGADQGNSLKYFEYLLALLQFPQALAQQILPTFILAPGANLSSGVVASNPLIVGTTCRATEVAVACGEGPVDEDLIIDLTVGVGGPSIFTSPIVVPAGTAANVVVLWSEMATAGGTWIPQNSVLVPVVSYNKTGANPTPAQSVSIQIRGNF